MSAGWKNWVTMVGGVASIAVLVMTLSSTGLLDFSDDDGEVQREYRFIPWGGSGEEGEQKEDEEQGEVDAAPPDEKQRWIRMVDADDRPVDARVLFNAPGMWPFVSKETEPGGYLELPPADTEMLDGRSLQLYELVARPADGEEERHGFWGVVSGPEEAVSPDEATSIRMQEAAPLELTVVDTEGQPIEGAYLRLSRDSVGLVHLNYTTREDGRARFRAIPKGTYYLTLDAQGYARTTITVEHSARMEGQLQVTMDDGAGLRLPHSWRGPPVQQLAARGGASGKSGDDADGSGEAEGDGAGIGPGGGRSSQEAAPEGESGGDSPEGSQQTVSVDVYAATQRGSGVRGAWIEAWAGGQRIAESKSAGNAASVMEVLADTPVEFVATHAGWGEGTKTVESAGDDDVVIELDGALFAQTAARDRLTGVGAIEDALEVELVDDGERWLIDLPEPGTAAESAGIERGDALLFVRRDGGGTRAFVERGGEIISIPVR